MTVFYISRRVHEYGLGDADSGVCSARSRKRGTCTLLEHWGSCGYPCFVCLKMTERASEFLYIRKGAV